MDTKVKNNLIESYQTDGGFIVHDAEMLERLYRNLGLDPKISLDRRVYELEALTHFFYQDVIALAQRLGITKEDYVLSLGEGNGAPSRLLVKMFGCSVTGIDINPNQVAKAKECAILHGVSDKTQYYEQNVEDLSLEKKDFTKAFVNETCGHWQNKDKAFNRIYIHLRKGAKIGFNVWLKGDKGTLNEAYDLVPEFKGLYKPGIWFQDDLNTYQYLLGDCGFKILEIHDTTDKLDIKMRARLKAGAQWDIYGRIMGEEARRSGWNYYAGMLKTHYDFLRYGVIIAEKPKV